jgi:hypothetical protein
MKSNLYWLDQTEEKPLSKSPSKHRAKRFLFSGLWFLGLFIFLVFFWLSTRQVFELNKVVISGQRISTPAFVNDAGGYLQAVLLERSCVGKHIKGRFYLHCTRRDRSDHIDGEWSSGSGLWEVRGRASPVRREIFYEDNLDNLLAQGPELLRFQLHPVDQRAQSLARYILDPNLMGEPSRSVEASAILSYFRR